MFRFLRTAHKWMGLGASLFLILISVTGLLLAMKSRFDAIRPATREAAKMASLAESVSLDAAAQAAFSAGLAELKTEADIGRFEIRPKDGLYKVLSKEGYWEVQVEAKTGKVLSVGKRNDQLLEQIHDFSFFADWTHAFLLPLVAIVLFGLGCSGVYISLVPVWRRWVFQREQAKKNPASK